MDFLRTLPASWLGGRAPSRKAHDRRQKQAADDAEAQVLSTSKLLAYVNMKASLIFCDLAVGVAIPVYLEVLSLDIGTSSA